MFAPKILRCCRSITNQRYITQSAKKFESKASDSASKTSPSSSTSSASKNTNSTIGSRMVIPENWEKWLLVWVKKYPKGEVPDRVSAESMHQAKSRARVKTANIMIAVGLLMCATTVYFAKSAKETGGTIEHRIEKWHRNQESTAKSS